MVEVKIYFKGVIYDLSPYIEPTSISLNVTGDGTFDSGTFVIPNIEKDALGLLDMSRPLPRFARIRMDLNGKIVDLVVNSDLQKRIADTTRYVHNVNVGSPSKMLADYSTAALTVTQPQGDISSYYRTINKYDNPMHMMVPTNSNYVNIPFSVRSNSIDTDILDAMTIKSDAKVKIDLNIKFINSTHVPALNMNPPVNVKIKIGTYEQVFEIKADEQTTFRWLTVGSTESSRNLTLEYNNVGTNVVSVQVCGPDMAPDTNLAIYESTLSIYTSDTFTMSKISLDYVVEKLLNNEMNKQKFYLDQNSKALLSKFSSYEWTLQASYLWLQLTRIADYVKAFPRAYFEDDTMNSRIMVELVLFDELSTEEEIPDYDLEQTEATIEDYSSAIEVNASNVYSENTYLSEHSTLRVEAVNAQITTDGLIIPTKHKIGQVIELRWQINKAITFGVEGESDYAANEIFTLKNAVFDKRYYDTLPTESDYSLIGRQGYNQNNTLYYIDGEQHIRGCSNLGGRLIPETWTTSEYSRAIYEVVLSHIARERGLNPKHVDVGDVATDNLIRVEVVYRPYIETNAVVFKDDQSGFEFKSRKLLNESMTVNNPDVLSAYAQGIANRSGGTKHTYSGITVPSRIPRILTKYNDKLLFAYTLTMINEEDCAYTLYYIKDYAFISSYESYDKKERIYQVPNTTVLERVIKKNNFILITETTEFGDNFGYTRNIKDFVQHLIGISSASKPKYARLRNVNGADIIDAILDISSQALGRTIEFRVSPKDNYSAGLQKYQVGANWYQKDYRYTNQFGRVEDIFLNFYEKLPNYNVATLNDLPKSPGFTSTDLMFSFGYNLRKDAREIPIISAQYTYLSGSDNFVVYDDIAKYCNLLNRTDTLPDFSFTIATLDYIPSVNAKFIDITRVSILPTNSVSMDDSSLSRVSFTITTNENKPIAFFNIRTLELFLVDKRTLSTRTIHFSGKGD